MIKIRFIDKVVLLMCLLAGAATATPNKLAPEVLKRASEIHAGFKGEKGRVAQFR